MGERASAKLHRWLPTGRNRRRTVKYLCFGYYDKSKFDGMAESERNAMFEPAGVGAVEKRFRDRRPP
jgi:hypothetical protein